MTVVSGEAVSVSVSNRNHPLLRIFLNGLVSIFTGLPAGFFTTLVEPPACPMSTGD